MKHTDDMVEYAKQLQDARGEIEHLKQEKRKLQEEINIQREIIMDLKSSKEMYARRVEILRSQVDALKRIRAKICVRKNEHIRDLTQELTRVKQENRNYREASTDKLYLDHVPKACETVEVRMYGMGHVEQYRGSISKIHSNISDRAVKTCVDGIRTVILANGYSAGGALISALLEQILLNADVISAYDLTKSRDVQ